MPTVAIALLRGINVGGHHRIGMEPLRAVFRSLGIDDPHTCLQSGNVVFRTTERDLVRLGERLEDSIHSAFGFRPAVMLRSAAELAKTAAVNPFGDRADIDPAKLIVLFLARDPGKAARAKTVALETEQEQVRAGTRELYVYFSNGLARPKLTATALEKALGVPGTGRNWNTVTKLVEMARQMDR